MGCGYQIWTLDAPYKEKSMRFYTSDDDIVLGGHVTPYTPPPYFKINIGCVYHICSSQSFWRESLKTLHHKMVTLPWKISISLVMDLLNSSTLDSSYRFWKGFHMALLFRCWDVIIVWSFQFDKYLYFHWWLD